MDNLEIDRILRATLSEDPSPEFVARVRTALAEAPRPSVVAGWLRPAAAIGCAAVVAIAVALPREEAQQKQEAQLKLSPTEQVLSPTERVLSPTERVLSPTERVLRRTEAIPAAAGLKPSTTTVHTETAAVVVPTFSPAVALAKVGRSAESAQLLTRLRAATPQEPPLPEVIIAAGDVEALLQFVSSARDRRFVARFEEAPTPTPWAMNDLAIAPITVEPLDSTQSHNN